MHGLLADEVAQILALFDQWGRLGQQVEQARLGGRVHPAWVRMMVDRSTTVRGAVGRSVSTTAPRRRLSACDWSTRVVA